MVRSQNLVHGLGLSPAWTRGRVRVEGRGDSPRSEDSRKARRTASPSPTLGPASWRQVHPHCSGLLKQTGCGPPSALVALQEEAQLLRSGKMWLVGPALPQGQHGVVLSTDPRDEAVARQSLSLMLLRPMGRVLGPARWTRGLGAA